MGEIEDWTAATITGRPGNETANPERNLCRQQPGPRHATRRTAEPGGLLVPVWIYWTPGSPAVTWTYRFPEVRFASIATCALGAPELSHPRRPGHIHVRASLGAEWADERYPKGGEHFGAALARCNPIWRRNPERAAGHQRERRIRSRSRNRRTALRAELLPQRRGGTLHLVPGLRAVPARSQPADVL